MKMKEFGPEGVCVPGLLLDLPIQVATFISKW